MLDVLAVAPHPDDAEVAMGGTLLTLKAQGWTTGILDLTNGEPTPMGSPEQRLKEAARAKELLGLDFRRTLDLPNRYLEDTMENRKKVTAVLREVRPRLIFISYWEDSHPDHVAACRLMEACRFYCKLSKSDIPGAPFTPPKVLHFFSNHYRLQARPGFIFDISGHLEQKLAAVAAYRSQFNQERGNLGILDRLRDHAGYWGSLINREAGEVFASREPVGLSSLDALCL